MEKRFIAIFVGEIGRQCKFATLASEDIKKSYLRDIDRFWYSSQSYFVSVAIISRILWPIKKFKARGDELRTLLDVKDDSPLHDRKFRDYLEHFDEQLEGWMTSSARHYLVDSNILFEGAIVGVEPSDFPRNFNHSKVAFTFRGREYRIEPIQGAVIDLLTKTEKYDIERLHVPRMDTTQNASKVPRLDRKMNQGEVPSV